MSVAKGASAFNCLGLAPRGEANEEYQALSLPAGGQDARMRSVRVIGAGDVQSLYLFCNVVLFPQLTRIRAGDGAACPTRHPQVCSRDVIQQALSQEPCQSAVTGRLWVQAANAAKLLSGQLERLTELDRGCSRDDVRDALVFLRQRP